MMLSTGGPDSENKWMADSGSSHHLKGDTVGMFDIQACPPGMQISQVQGVIKVQQWGSVLLEVDGHSGKSVIKLSQTLVVPEIRVNLLSLQRVVDKGYLPVFGEIDGKVLIEKMGQKGSLEQVATMSVSRGKLTLDCRQVMPVKGIQRGLGHVVMAAQLTLPLLHRRLGHSAEGTLHKMIKGNMVRGIDKVEQTSLGICDPCKLGKNSLHPHHQVPAAHHGQYPLDLVVVDLAGPNRPQTIGGKRYDMVLIDTFSRRSWVKLLAKKSNAAEVLRRWIPIMENQCGRKLRVLRSDNGGEFISNEFKNWLELRGTEQQLTPSYSPQSNGIAERGNRTLQDKARTMMIEAGVPGSLWGEFILSACVLRNLTFTSTLDVTPLEMWSGTKPSIERLRVLGSKTYCQFNKTERAGKYSA